MKNPPAEGKAEASRATGNVHSSPRWIERASQNQRDPADEDQSTIEGKGIREERDSAGIGWFLRRDFGEFNKDAFQRSLDQEWRDRNHEYPDNYCQNGKDKAFGLGCIFHHFLLCRFSCKK